MKKRVSSVLLALAMLLSLLPTSVWAVEPAASDTGVPSVSQETQAEPESDPLPSSDGENEETDPAPVPPVTVEDDDQSPVDVPSEEEDENDLPEAALPEEEIEEVEVFTIEADIPVTSAEYGISTFAVNRAIATADETNPLWIERLAFPTYAKTFYNTLVSNRGKDGMLVDFTKATAKSFNYTSGAKAETYVIPVPYTGDADDAVAYVNAAYCAFLRDYPEVFWLDGTLSYVPSTNDQTIYMILQSKETASNGTVTTSSAMNSTYEGATVRTVQNAIDQRDEYIDTIISAIPTGADNYEKVRHFSTWLTKNNGYNTSLNLNNLPPECRNCMGALEGNRGTSGPVCEGYAKAFMVLCQEVGINCVLVDGPTDLSRPDTTGHMWNSVQMEAKWYGVDVTWNDPVYSEAPIDRDGYLEWLLVGKAKMEGTNSDGHHVQNKPSVLSFPDGPTLSTDAYVTLGDLQSITIGTQPTKTQYEAGEKFAPAGMVVLANYEGKSSVKVSNYTFPDEALTVGQNQVTITLVHTYVKNGYSYTTTETVDVPITVTAALQALPANALTATTGSLQATYDGTPKEVTVTLQSGITTENAGTYTLKYGNSTTAPTNAGSYKVTATFAGGSTYRAGTVDVGTLVIAKATPKVAPTSLSLPIGGTGTLTLTPAVTGATYSSSSNSVATVSGGTVTGVAAGNATITVDCPVTANTEAVTLPVPVEVTQGTLTGIAITTQPTKTAYVEGDTFDPTGMVVTATYQNNDSTIRTVPVTGYTCTPDPLTRGTTAVTVSFGGQTATVAVTVKNALTLADLTVGTTFPLTVKYGETYTINVAGTTSTGTITVQYYDKAGAAVAKPADVGVYTVKASCAAGTTFAASEVELGTLTITQVTAEITAPDSLTVGIGGTVNIGATVTHELPLSYSSDNTDAATVTNGIVSGIAEGVAHITITAAGNDNVIGTTKTVTVTVSPIQFKVGTEDATAANTLTVKSNPTYGDTWADLVRIKSGIIITAIDGTDEDETQSHFSLVFPTATAPNAGTYTVKLVYTNGTKTADVCSVSVTVAPKSAAGAVVTVANATYTGEALEPTVTVVLDGKTLVKDTDYTVAYTNNTNAGTGTATVTFKGNYNGTATQNFTIAKQKINDIAIAQNILTNSGGRTYSIDVSKYEGLTITVPDLSSNALVSAITYADGKLTLTGKAVAEENVTATVTIPVTCTNYEGNGAGGALNIVLTLTSIDKEDAGVTAVTASPVAKTYGDGTFPLSAKLGDGVTGTNDDWTWTVDASGVVSVTGNGASATVTILKAGTAKVKASFESDTHIGEVEFTVNVAKKAVTIGPKGGSVYTGSTYTPLDLSGLTAADQAKVKITPTPEFTATKNGTSVALADITKTTGTYKVVWSNLKDSKGEIQAVLSEIDLNNYVITLNDAEVTLTVTSRPSSGGSSGGGSTTTKPSTTTTTTNSDGSTTTTTTATNGTVTETTKRPDGSQTVVETKKDGTVTTTDTGKDGTVTKTVENKDGSSNVSVSQPDGVRATTDTNKSGKSTSTVTLPSGVVNTANQSKDTISLPIPAVRASSSSSDASTVTVNPGSNREVTVEIPLRSPNAGTVAVLVNSNGQEQVIRTSVPTDDGVAIQVTGNVTVKLVDNSKSFADVRSSDWYRNAVDYASSRSLFNGVSSTEFAPNTAMSRGMLAVVIHNLEYNPSASINTSFADVASSAYYAQAISWASNKGLITGYGDGMMGPNDPISREQLAVILWNYAGKPAVTSGSLSFNDASEVSTWARNAVIWANQKGILNGVGGGNLAPKSEATRAQVAQMLMTYMQSTH